MISLGITAFVTATATVKTALVSMLGCRPCKLETTTEIVAREVQLQTGDLGSSLRLYATETGMHRTILQLQLQLQFLAVYSQERHYQN
ncbi:hypothetical protein COCC4DRAFT_33133 [Bipolaris maydis ATCC 48331]|uniref:Secreted protein n=2 Tax=Cochliobolus heterostrophus TaxID=5016 RepID=M2UF84_COCH5|nr:uncharacterized protein COCC4DRAFT_33133 [Bipolaris maydis ATCC 48331]EMD86567.1 hypothetical protein COCHEDRAFT_1197995 [Bipolaris maydis C5]ENI02982.1 hypothetical protein COCC4DRAFT_33133 [Bipolaris maydis ATCC 48331]KAJ6267508.1 hypothetical protein PSV08DRAFT_326212 [Bipolaris maydis]KAJ6267551.1 hypothetical protein PSV08DRAFT_326303 [Bipolaris maydis]